jgi:hypothetical protein
LVEGIETDSAINVAFGSRAETCFLILDRVWCRGILGRKPAGAIAIDAGLTGKRSQAVEALTPAGKALQFLQSRKTPACAGRKFIIEPVVAGLEFFPIDVA